MKLVIISAILVLVIITDTFDLKRHSAFLFNIVWISLMIGSMTAVFYSLMLAVVMFLGGCGVLIWYIAVVNEEIKCLKNDVE